MGSLSECAHSLGGRVVRERLHPDRHRDATSSRSSNREGFIDSFPFALVLRSKHRRLVELAERRGIDFATRRRLDVLGKGRRRVRLKVLGLRDSNTLLSVNRCKRGLFASARREEETTHGVFVERLGSSKGGGPTKRSSTSGERRRFSLRSRAENIQPAGTRPSFRTTRTATHEVERVPLARGLGLVRSGDGDVAPRARRVDRERDTSSRSEWRLVR